MTKATEEWRERHDPNRRGEPINRTAVVNLLIRAYAALRTVDATAIENERLPMAALDRVSDAVAAIEEFCRERSIDLDR